MPGFDIIAVISLSLIAVGHLSNKRKGHLLTGLGWAVFGFYWALEFPYYLSIADFINVVLSIGALPIFLFLAYHEFLSYEWDEDFRPLSFLASVTAGTGLPYFLIKYVPFISKSLINVVAYQSVRIANLFGLGLSVSGGSWVNGEYLAHINGVPISIILACTGIQAILVAFSLIYFSRAETRVKRNLLILVIPIIYVVNLFRNVIVFLMVDANGISDFEFAHNIVGKGLSTVVLLILTLYTFKKIPQMYDDINGLFDLPWRKEPGHDYVAHFDAMLGVKKEGDVAEVFEREEDGPDGSSEDEQ